MTSAVDEWSIGGLVVTVETEVLIGDSPDLGPLGLI